MTGRLILWGFVFVLFLIASLVVADEEITKTVFPIGELFEPLVADPKEPQFSAGLHQVNSSGRLGEFTAGVVSYGENFGLMRLQVNSAQQWQVSITGGLFAQFNMDTDSKDLINADYGIGISGTHRRGPVSYRLRVLHQSTHLGDELLLGNLAPERINFSLEAVDFLASYEWDKLRLYGGAAYLLHVEPSDLLKTALQFGGEYRNAKHRLLNGRWIGGINLTAFEGDGWNLNTAVKIGLEFGNPGSGNRRTRVMLERFDGNAPFGQFFDVGITSYGLSGYLLF